MTVISHGRPVFEGGLESLIASVGLPARMRLLLSSMAGPGGWLMHDYVSRLLIQERGAFVRREEGISSSGSADSAIEFANPVHVFSCLPRSSTS